MPVMILGILEMNKRWIQDSQIVAARFQSSNEYLERFEYLDIMGLFETGWMVYNHTIGSNTFGYPR